MFPSSIPWWLFVRELEKSVSEIKAVSITVMQYGLFFRCSLDETLGTMINPISVMQ